MVGLGSLIAKVAAAAVIPRVMKALSAMGGTTETFRANPSEPISETVSAPVQRPEKVLYERSLPTAHNYRYCGNNPINFTDPLGLAGGPVSPITVAQNITQQIISPYSIWGPIESTFIVGSAYGGPASAPGMVLRSALRGTLGVLAPIGPGLGSGSMPPGFSSKGAQQPVSVASGTNSDKIVGVIEDQSTLECDRNPIAKGKQIRDIRRLVAEYGGIPQEWKKRSGTATLVTSTGKNVKNAEIHWYENLGNRYEFKWSGTRP